MPEWIELFPGVRLTAVQSSRFRTGCFRVSFLSPLRSETAARNALIPDLLLRGCRTCPDPTAVSRFLDDACGASVGGLVRKHGQIQTAGIYAAFLEDAVAQEPLLERLCGFVHDLLFEPLVKDGGFDPAGFAVECANLRSAMRAEKNDKALYAIRQLCRNMFRGEPYAVPASGEEEDLDRITPKNLYEQYQALLAHAPAEVFYMGSETPQRAAELLRGMLRPLAGRSCESMPQPGFRAPGPVRSLTETGDLTQARLAVGFRTPIPQTLDELAAAQVFTAVYGGSYRSRLFLRMREEASLCYAVSASLDRREGAMFVTAGIDAEQTEPALTEIRRQLALCAAGGIGSDELDQAKALLISGLRGVRESPGRMEEFYAGVSLGGPAGSIEDRAAAIGRVTAEQASAFAAAAREDFVYLLKGAET